jgi:hypothetical protein
MCQNLCIRVAHIELCIHAAHIEHDFLLFGVMMAHVRACVMLLD